MAVLVEFSELEELRLPSATNLRLGAYTGQWCGTNSILLRGTETAESNNRWKREELEEYEKVASIVLEKLPQLKRLIIDDQELSITHGEDGKASASWPWSGLLDEYLYEILGMPKA